MDSPHSCNVSQSWGSMTRSTRAAACGSFSRSHASVDSVMDGTGAMPTCSIHHWIPCSSIMRVAWGSLRMSFHSRASWTGFPSPSTATMPCCWPATETPTTSSCSATPASRHAARSASRGGVHVRAVRARRAGRGHGPAGGCVHDRHLAGLGESMPTTVLVMVSALRAGELPVNGRADRERTDSGNGGRRWERPAVQSSRGGALARRSCSTSSRRAVSHTRWFTSPRAPRRGRRGPVPFPR